MKKLYRVYVSSLMLLLMLSLVTMPAFAADDMWTVANKIIVDVYTHIAGISTVLAGLMSAVAVIGAKLSNNQHKVRRGTGSSVSGSHGPLSTGSEPSSPMSPRSFPAWQP